MVASDNLSAHQFGPVADSPSGFPSHVAMMPVHELVKYADPTRMSDTPNRAHVEELADKFRASGYDASRHGGMDHWGTRYDEHGDSRVLPAAQEANPIHLRHQDEGSDLFNGNHRTWAGHLAGLTHLPVLVTDYRSKR